MSGYDLLMDSVAAGLTVLAPVLYDSTRLARAWDAYMKEGEVVISHQVTQYATEAVPFQPEAAEELARRLLESAARARAVRES